MPQEKGLQTEPAHRKCGRKKLSAGTSEARRGEKHRKSAFTGKMHMCPEQSSESLRSFPSTCSTCTQIGCQPPQFSQILSTACLVPGNAISVRWLQQGGPQHLFSARYSRLFECEHLREDVNTHCAITFDFSAVLPGSLRAHVREQIPLSQTRFSHAGRLG